MRLVGVLTILDGVFSLFWTWRQFPWNSKSTVWIHCLDPSLLMTFRLQWLSGIRSSSSGMSTKSVPGEVWPYHYNSYSSNFQAGLNSMWGSPWTVKKHQTDPKYSIINICIRLQFICNIRLHIRSVFCKLYWLLISFRAESKVLILAFRTLDDLRTRVFQEHPPPPWTSLRTLLSFCPPGGQLQMLVWLVGMEEHSYGGTHNFERGRVGFPNMYF